MIVRIVKLTFLPGKTEEFLGLYRATHEKIKASKGCSHLELLYDIHNPDVLFTYSLWDSEDDLLNYRSSEFFNYTWSRAKPLFAGEAEAWTLEKKIL